MPQLGPSLLMTLDVSFTIVIFLQYRPQELLANIGLQYKNLPGTNTLVYFAPPLPMKNKLVCLFLEGFLYCSPIFVSNACGLYYKNTTITNDASRVIRSDAPSCGITYLHHSDDSIVVIDAPSDENKGFITLTF
jgi:hypothetical protein